MTYWDKSTRDLLKILADHRIIRTVRYIPGGVEFFYADRIVTLKLGEARWFALGHLYHLMEKENDR